MAHPNRGINESDFTNLFIASDDISKKSQSYYVLIIGIDLVLMLIASAFSVYDWEDANFRKIVYGCSGLFLLASLILTIILLSKKFEDAWYQGRALAESCKTLSWRFMTCSELFERQLSDEQASEKFVERIGQLTREFSHLTSLLNTELINKPVITPFMLSVRGLTLLERKKFYVENRIENQKEWYSSKAEFNKKRYNFWFGMILTAQAISIVCIVYMISNPTSKFNLVGLFTTISATSISWLQLKRHQELKQAYTTATQELNIIASLSNRITAEQEFSEFVLDSENAVSREHTLWIAQRRR